MAHYKFQTDGSHLPASKYRPNSTGFGGFLIRTDKSGFSSRKAFKDIHPSTNNVAEWSAVVDALEYTKQQLSDATTVVIETDSELVVKQINGQYEVKDQRLKSLQARFNACRKEIEAHVQVVHVPREMNEMADSLSKLGSLLKR